FDIERDSKQTAPSSKPAQTRGPLSGNRQKNTRGVGSSPETWLGMQMGHDLWQARSRADEIRVRSVRAPWSIRRWRNVLTAIQDSLQCVQPEARQVHILRCSAPLEARENVTKFLDMFRRHALCHLPIVQCLKVVMFERPDHLANM